MTAAALSPARPEWRVLPFSDDSAHYLSRALRRLYSISLPLEFVYLALSRGEGRDAVASVGAVVLTAVVAMLSLPTLSNRAWHAARPEGSELPPMIGGTWWAVTRLLLVVAVLSSIVCSLIGYATLGAHLHTAISTTCLLIAIAFLLHKLVADLLDAAAAPGTPSGTFVRQRLRPRAGQHAARPVSRAAAVRRRPGPAAGGSPFRRPGTSTPMR